MLQLSVLLYKLLIFESILVLNITFIISIFRIHPKPSEPWLDKPIIWNILISLKCWRCKLMKFFNTSEWLILLTEHEIISTKNVIWTATSLMHYSIAYPCRSSELRPKSPFHRKILLCQHFVSAFLNVCLLMNVRSNILQGIEWI